MTRELWQLNHNEKIEFLAKVAEKHSAEAAKAIRAYIRKPKTTKQMIIDYVMNNPGKTMREIAEHFDCVVPYVSVCVDRYGLEKYISVKRRGRRI